MSKMTMGERWSQMHPEKKRKAVMGIGIAALVVLSGVIIATNETPKQKGSAKKDEGIPNLLMTTTGREMGLSGVSNDVQTQRQELAELRAEIERLKKGGSTGGAVVPPPADPTLALEDMAGQIEGERGAIVDSGVGPNLRVPPPAPPVPQLPDIQGGVNGPIAPPPPPPVVAPTINTTRSETPKVSAAVRNLRHVYLPTGSLLTGVLLTGLDAPTGRNSQSAPIPVVVRVKHEAILPSQYRSDVREAFILAAGFGDLSSERAYLRAEKFSMILTNGEVIDIPIKMSAVGNDGKSGLRGRIVSKQGTVIAKALAAGTADGISRAFGGNRVVSRGGELPSDRELAEAGLQGGATSALDRVTDYYLQQADAMHPVIEVDAGRDVTFILLEGTELIPRSVEEAEKKRSAPGAAKPATAAAAK